MRCEVIYDIKTVHFVSATNKLFFEKIAVSCLADNLIRYTVPRQLPFCFAVIRLIRFRNFNFNSLLILLDSKRAN